MAVAPAATSNNPPSLVDKLLGTLGGLGSAYFDYRGAKEAAKVEAAQASAPVSFNLPNPNLSNFVSNPENLQKVMLYTGLAAAIGVGAYLVMKKL